ncbi:MAG: flagellin [Methanomicrobiales archaeon HGW-Methanomicrobiales-1]|jgi:flagellin FlaB|nr:MAG: flagellin [Methanomicrobiales archaeon HGW-Methanomicrobiales-1]
MNSLKHNDEGFTGLEAAIVLIAFVVVAAVFSYVVLGAGFFTTQKAQESVHTGVQQATSALEPSGPVTVRAATGGLTADNVSFYLQLAAGGAPVDMGTISYTVSTANRVSTYSAGQVTLEILNEVTTGNSLEPREMAFVTIPLAAASDGVWTSDQLTVNDKFIVEVKPSIGAALPISRTMPLGMTAGTYYEVF